MNLVALIGGIISSVPEAIRLWNELAPLVDQHAKLSDQDVARIQPMALVAHAAVESWHDILSSVGGNTEQPVK